MNKFDEVVIDKYVIYTMHKMYLQELIKVYDKNSTLNDLLIDVLSKLKSIKHKLIKE